MENAYDRLQRRSPGGQRRPRPRAPRERRAGGSGTSCSFGDDSFDPDDRVGFGGRAFVPSLNGWDGIFGRVASENRYADVNGDGRPEVAIGRLPARTPTEADALVDKVERQQALLARGACRHVFAVDNPGPDGFDFAAEAQHGRGQDPPPRPGLGRPRARASPPPADASSRRWPRGRPSPTTSATAARRRGRTRAC